MEKYYQETELTDRLHILRHEWLLKLIIEGSVEGKKYRGRPKLEYKQKIITGQECYSYVGLKRKAENRGEWRIPANQSTD